jgi:hypothetical protein
MLNILIQRILAFLLKEQVNGRKFVPGGLLPHVDDERDWEYSKLGGIMPDAYPPKASVKTLGVKDQGVFNTCSWHAYASQREVEEGVQMSPRASVCKARQKGLISGTGLAYLRDNHKLGTDWGVAQESVLPNELYDWETYSTPAKLNGDVEASANAHKAGGYFLCRSKSDFLCAVADGHAVEVGIPWMSSYNMSSGFSAPWVLPWGKGVCVGTHAVLLVGYDVSSGLLRFQNSFSASWGENGFFYVRMSDFFNSSPVGFVTVDLDKTDFAKFLANFTGRDVKGNLPAIYRMENGEKRPYPDEITFYAFGGKFSNPQTWTPVAQKLLDQAPLGRPMEITESPAWPVLKDQWQTIVWLRSPDNFARIDVLMKSHV